MANSRFYSSTALETTLTNSITPSTTIIQVAATTGFPGSLPYTLALDYGAAGMELVDVTGVAGLNLTVTRAIDGTSAASHNAGAAVRHVSSARDFTDSRTHEQDNSAVHGVTGDLVGTTDTQTLTNKTIDGGTLSGTFAGVKTFSGSTTFSAAANLNSGGALVGTFTGSPTLSGNPTFSGTPQITNAVIAGTVTGNPTFSGTVNYTGNIQTTTSIVNPAHSTIVSGDTFDRFRLLSDGNMAWGPGSANRDTNLYRSAADTLTTDDNFIVGDDLTVTNNASVGSALTVTGNLTVGGVGQILFARKTADTSRSSTITATADPHLSVAVSANATYEVEAYVIYNSNTTADFGMQFGVPAGATGSWSGVGWGRAAGASVGTDGWTVRMNENSITQNRTYGGDTTDITIHAKGIVLTAGTAGNFTLDWAQAVVDGGATIVRTNSYMTLRRVA